MDLQVTSTTYEGLHNGFFYKVIEDLKRGVMILRQEMTSFTPQPSWGTASLVSYWNGKEFRPLTGSDYRPEYVTSLADAKALVERQEDVSRPAVNMHG